MSLFGLLERVYLWFRFLRDDDDKELNELSPDDRIAVKYYRGLFKEFALVDLKHYKSGQVRIPFPSYFSNGILIRVSSLPSAGAPNPKSSRASDNSRVETRAVRTTRQKTTGRSGSPSSSRSSCRLGMWKRARRSRRWSR